MSLPVGEDAYARQENGTQREKLNLLHDSRRSGLGRDRQQVVGRAGPERQLGELETDCRGICRADERSLEQ